MDTVDPSLFFLSYVNMVMTIPQLGTLKPLRENDQALMEIMLHSQLSTKEIIIFNNTRLFLQITSVAEIITTSGTMIHSSFTISNPPTQRPKTHGRSNLIWPHQPPPNHRMRRVWLKGINLLCKPSSWHLLQHLGKWSYDCSVCRIWYGHYIDNQHIRICQYIWEQHYNTHTKQYYRDSNT
jgi:hypothetical protein